MYTVVDNETNEVTFLKQLSDLKSVLRFDYCHYGDKKYSRVTYDKLQALMVRDNCWNDAFKTCLDRVLDVLFVEQVYLANSPRLTKKAGSFKYGVTYTLRRKNAANWHKTSSINTPIGDTVGGGLEIRAMTCDYDEQVVHVYAHSANKDVKRKDLHAHIERVKQMKMAGLV